MDKETIARIIYEAMHEGWNCTPWYDLGTGQEIYLKAAQAVQTKYEEEA